MLVFLKANALAVFALIGIVFFVLAMGGKIRWALLLVIFLLPLRNVIDKLQDIPMGKDFIDIMILGMILGWFINFLTQRRKFLEGSPINWISIVMILYIFISTLQGAMYLNHPLIFDIADPRVQQWKNFCLFPVLFFLVFNNTHEEKWVWRIVIVMCLAMLLMDYYLVRQFGWYSSLESRRKVSGTFTYLGPNEIAAFYNQYTVILISLWFAIRKRLPKLLLAGLIAINIFCILFLFSRAAYVGLIAGLLIILLFKKRVLLIPLAIIAVSWQSVLPEKVIQRINQTHDEYGNLDKSAADRLIIWKKSLELFNENPVMGVGFGVFQFMGYELTDTHNVYLKIMAEQGVIGISLFLILLIIFLRQGITLFHRGRDDLSKALGLGFMACIVTLAVNNVFGDRWTYLELSAYLWIFAGLVERLNVMAVQKPTLVTSKSPKKAPARLKTKSNG